MLPIEFYLYTCDDHLASSMNVIPPKPILLMDTIIWNCNGATSRSFLCTLKDVIHRYKLGILGLLETKVSGKQADDICNKLGFDYWVRVEAMGFNGGIWVLWKEHYQLNVIKTHPQFIHMQIKSQGGHLWHLSVVYGSPNSSLRRFLWRDLNQYPINNATPWLIIVGDFNSITS